MNNEGREIEIPVEFDEPFHVSRKRNTKLEFGNFTIPPLLVNLNLMKEAWPVRYLHSLWSVKLRCLVRTRNSEFDSGVALGLGRKKSHTVWKKNNSMELVEAPWHNNYSLYHMEWNRIKPLYYFTIFRSLLLAAPPKTPKQTKLPLQPTTQASNSNVGKKVQMESKMKTK